MQATVRGGNGQTITIATKFDDSGKPTEWATGKLTTDIEITGETTVDTSGGTSSRPSPQI